MNHGQNILFSDFTQQLEEFKDLLSSSKEYRCKECKVKISPSSKVRVQGYPFEVVCEKCKEKNGEENLIIEK